MGRADDTAENRLSLKGLRGVEVFVGDLPPEVEQNGLGKSEIQTDVELKLRQAGILVLESKAGQPWLSVSVNVLTRTEGAWPFAITLDLRQSATLIRDPSILSSSAVTWSAGTFGDIGRLNVRNLRDTVKDVVDRFINAYLAVNPKK